jgi:hypothetical protein
MRSVKSELSQKLTDRHISLVLRCADARCAVCIMSLVMTRSTTIPTIDISCNARVDLQRRLRVRAVIAPHVVHHTATTTTISVPSFMLRPGQPELMHRTSLHRDQVAVPDADTGFQATADHPSPLTAKSRPIPPLEHRTTPLNCQSNILRRLCTSFSFLQGIAASPRCVERVVCDVRTAALPARSVIGRAGLFLHPPRPSFIPTAYGLSSPCMFSFHNRSPIPRSASDAQCSVRRRGLPNFVDLCPMISRRPNGTERTCLIVRPLTLGG